MVRKALERGSKLHSLNPLTDPRWQRFVDRHPCSSAFHTVAWMRALNRTCRYEPVVYTTTPDSEELRNGVAFCRVDSRITGGRLVSMPFADHCDPLDTEGHALQELYAAFPTILREERLKYIELRPRQAISCDPPSGLFHSGYIYRWHVLDLTPDLDTIFERFHKDSTQRKIRRAEREGLKYSGGVSDALLDAFYRLLIITRRRHGVPPQPKSWFRNLADCFGESLKIRVASLSSRPVAAMLTLRHKDTLVFKYGCSNSSFHAMGGTHLLFWRAIQDAKESGLKQFDLGRSNTDNTGLITFKNRWGASSSSLVYRRVALKPSSFANLSSQAEPWYQRAVRRSISRLPDPLFESIGALLFRHLG